ncbi:kinase-like protein [Backusella circina FSU 941]|nr:kinase-like protein [Backusella circina FSU 941]
MDISGFDIDLNKKSTPFTDVSSLRKTTSIYIDSDFEPEPESFPTNKKKIMDSPYYSTEIGPRLDLGYQWPLKRARGFQKASSSNRNERLKTIEKIEKRKKKKEEKKKKKKKKEHNSRIAIIVYISLSKKNLLSAVTIHLKHTFCSKPEFRYTTDTNPKRILTKPSRAVVNDYDNENYDYILRVNEILGHEPQHQYRVIDILGQGTFGQVVKCERISTGKLYSVKVIKNKSTYKTQSCMEIEILKKLNRQLDPDDKHHILRLHYIFSHKNHMCLVFELLSYNLYDLIGHNRFKGFAPEKVRSFAVQILDTLCLLKEAKIIHCDLKPENILLINEKSHTLKVIDFGSACHEANRMYTYIQSRFYRSPEVLLGLRYTSAIDMWSFGCIVAELFLGIPIFPGISEYNQISKIVEMLGLPPKDMLSKGRNTVLYFNKRPSIIPEQFDYELKSREQYGAEQNKNELPGKKYFQHTNLEDLILTFNKGRPILSSEEMEKRRVGGTYVLKEQEELKKETQDRLCLLDFIKGILELNPLKRWTPHQALQHPFITQKPFTGPFQPDSQFATQSPVIQSENGKNITIYTFLQRIIVVELV